MSAEEQKTQGEAAVLGGVSGPAQAARPALKPLYLKNAAFERRAESFWRLGVLAPEDLLPIDLVAPLYGEHDPEVLLALAFALRAPRMGQVGVRLDALKEQLKIEVSHDELQSLAWPQPMSGWAQRVAGSALVTEFLEVDEAAPFVLQRREGRESGLLMTQRMYVLQEELAKRLRSHLQNDRYAGGQPHTHLQGQAAPMALTKLAQALLEESQIAESRVEDAQRLLQSPLLVVTGGPGTGKTTFIAGLLALLLAQHEELGAQNAEPLKIELAAPTGKAAQRIRESIQDTIRSPKLLRALRPTLLSEKSQILDVLESLNAHTVHRLLGIRPDGSSRHDEDLLISADVVLIDETSMVDLELMHRLMAAISPNTRVIFLGDPDQLASVEAGTVLADLMAAESTLSELGAYFVQLTKSWRSERAPELTKIAQDLRSGRPEQIDAVVTLMAREVQSPELIYLGPPKLQSASASAVMREGMVVQAQEKSAQGRPTPKQLDELAAPYLRPEGEGLRAGYASGLIQGLRALQGAGAKETKEKQQRWLSEEETQKRLLGLLESYRVLAVRRRGSRGVYGLEKALALRLQEKIRDAAPWAFQKKEQPYWLGRPILITRNDKQLGLFNGDIGLVLFNHMGQPVVVFAQPGGQIKTVEIPRLPAHEGGLVMTVHKSQGSQFGEVALVLAEEGCPIQTRELIYTGITRAQQRVRWLGSRAELREGLRQTVNRSSTLAQSLQGLSDHQW